MTESSSRDLAFAPPGPGTWTLERGHFDRGMTPVVFDLFEPGEWDGFADDTARYGLALQSIAMRKVNHHVYLRPIPVGEPKDKTLPKPPGFVIWTLSRVHPEFRRRTRAATATLAEKRWRADRDRWYDEQRPAAIERNRSLQGVDPGGLDDAGLADHLDALAANLRDGVRLHFNLTVCVLFAVGDFLVAARDAGIEPEEALHALRGSSPASAETVALLAPAVDAIRDAGCAPKDLDEVRALSAAASGAVDGYLEDFGWREIARFDVDAPTLGEQPAVVLSSLIALAGRDLPADAEHAGADVFMAQVPAAHRAVVAERLAEAAYVVDVRDDNAAQLLQWPLGLLRRALLEVGSRLAARAEVQDESHVLEVTVADLLAHLRGVTPLDAATVADLAAERAAALLLTPPVTIGSPEPAPPPSSLLPDALARVGDAVLTAIEQVFTPPSRGRLTGTGIGAQTVRGRARVARAAEEAFEVLEPGDVLVAPFTTPAYNAVLPILGGLVVEEGGAFSHAALVSREMDIPAVIGVADAVGIIPDGATIEVDAAAGTVTVVEERR